MIKYKLLCKNCDKSFDSWFASSLEFEKLKKKKFLICHYCNSKKINKKIKKYKKFIEKNFEYVGENFAYEARTIHYSNKKKGKGIYGTASTDEIKELREEGIDTEIIPWIEDKSN